MADELDPFPDILVETEESDEEIERREQLLKYAEIIEQLEEDESHIERSWKFFRDVLGSPVYFCAPMVGASELAFRMMVRKYGADIATTPMISAGGYVKSESYRSQFKFLEDSNADRPLIVQFWANEANALMNAAKLVEGKCDAVELNLGCPQQCARGGNYGAFLMNSFELLYEMVSTVYKNVDTPILCKVRIFKDYNKTLKMCRMLQNAGCSILTVHGRTKEEKRSAETLADWNVIKKLKEDLRIPVISNGNIKNFADVKECLEFTKCDGVMSACALLANPSLFSDNDGQVNYFELAFEYLEFAEKYHATSAQIRKHIFSILRRSLNQNVQIGNQLLLVQHDENINFPYIKNLLIELEETEIKRRDMHLTSHPQDHSVQPIS